MGTYVISKNVKDSIKHCILQVFWPKNEIIDFFSDSGCTTKDLIQVRNIQNQLKRNEIVDKVFKTLDSRPDNGTVAYTTMLEKLCAWTFLNPFYFDELGKLNKASATKSIVDLKRLRTKLEETNLSKERIRKAKIEKEKIAPYSREELKDHLNNLMNKKDKDGNKISEAQRGYELEAFLKNLCLLDKLDVTSSFKITGEQIDASLKFEGENYILEAKWQDKEIANDSLFQFAYKIEGKMHGRGIFLSINGYSEGAISALVKGKSLGTILFDGEDLIHAVSISTFSEILDKKVKAAQTMGRIYVNPFDLTEKKGYR